MTETTPCSISVEEALRRKYQQSEYETVETHREGLRLKVEPGKRPILLRKHIGRLAIAGRQVHRQKQRMEKIKGLLKKPVDEIKGLAAAHDGLRGFENDKDNLRTTVYPSHTIAWHRDKLKESLPTGYSTVVAEDLRVNMSVPLDRETPQGPLTAEKAYTAIYLGLLSLGFEPEELPSIVSTEINPRVDEAKLNEMLQSGQAHLLEGSATVQETWNVKTSRLRPDA